MNAPPLLLIGFVAWGSPEDLAKLEAAAKARGFRGGRIEQEEPETMVIFDRNAPRGPAMAFWAEVVAGKYGQFKVEGLVVKVADAADGIAPDELRKLDADVIRE